MKRIFTLLMGMVTVCGLLFGVVPNVNAVTYQWSTLDYPGAFWTTAHGIDTGNIVGGYGFSPNERHGFLYNGTTWSSFDFPGATETIAESIDAGNIVGRYMDASGYHGFLYDGTTWSSLDFPGGTWTIASGIDAGNIVGRYRDASGNFHGFLYNGTTWSSLDFPGALATHAYGINNAGNIVGSYAVASGYHGFLYNGTWSSLEFPGSALTTAFDIDDAGNIVGGHSDCSCEMHGFLYDGTTWSFLDYPYVSTYWSGIFGIDDGIIVGGYLAGSRMHGFLAAPVPEPGTLILLGSGLAGLVFYRKKKAKK